MSTTPVVTATKFSELLGTANVSPSELASTLSSIFGKNPYIDGINASDLVGMVETRNHPDKKPLELRLDGINFKNCNFIGIPGIEIHLLSQNSKFEKCTFKGNIKVGFTHQCRIQDSVFSSLTTRDSTLGVGADVIGCQFQDTNVDRWNFGRAKFENTKFTHSRNLLIRKGPAESVWTYVIRAIKHFISERKLQPYSRMAKCKFAHASFVRCEFHRQMIINCDFTNAHFYKTLFTGQNICEGPQYFSDGHNRIEELNFKTPLALNLKWSQIIALGKYPLFTISWIGFLISLTILSSIAFLNEHQFIQTIEYDIAYPKSLNQVFWGTLLLVVSGVITNLSSSSIIKEDSLHSWVMNKKESWIRYEIEARKKPIWRALAVISLVFGALFTFLYLAGNLAAIYQATLFSNLLVI